jgi:hypothetical protein
VDGRNAGRYSKVSFGGGGLEGWRVGGVGVWGWGWVGVWGGGVGARAVMDECIGREKERRRSEVAG